MYRLYKERKIFIIGKNTFLIWALIIVVVIGGYVGYTQLSQTPESTPPSEPGVEQPVSSQSTSQPETPKLDNTKDNSNTVNITSVSDITRDMKGQYVVTSGYITTISGGKGHTFITLKDVNNDKTIKGVLFRQENEENTGRKELLEQNAKTDNIINIEGKVDIYENELEIIIKKVY